MSFNTTGQSYEHDELSEVEKQSIIDALGVAEKGGDSSQDFAAKKFTTGRNSVGSTLGHLTFKSAANEMCIGTDNNYNDININHRLATGTTTAPKNWYWKAGSNNEWANFTLNDLTSKGNVTAVSFTPFTGCHVIPNNGQNFKIGELICIEAIESEDKKQPDWRGRYAQKGEQGIFGIVFEEYEEPKSIPEVGVNKFYSIACLGDMKVLCNGENGNIEYGDELCASSKNGEAMKFTGSWEDRKQICGKAGRSHTFKENEVILLDTAKE